MRSWHVAISFHFRFVDILHNGTGSVVPADSEAGKLLEARGKILASKEASYKRT
jgi:hypothetical protein